MYGGFSYTQLSVSDEETVNVPAWVGVGAIVVGGFLLLVPRKGLATA